MSMGVHHELKMYDVERIGKKISNIKKFVERIKDILRE